VSKVDNFYDHYYTAIFGTGTIGRMAEFAHKYMEKPFTGQSFNKILEVGSGSGQHRKHVVHDYKEYFEGDIRNPKSSAAIFDEKNNKKIARIHLDAQNLMQFNDQEFDRIIATCLVVHLMDPEIALKEWRRVTKSEGVITIYVPTEPSIFLRVFRFFTTKQKANRLGFNHSQIHYLEHRNMWLFINLLIEDIFKNDKITKKRFPIKFMSWNFSLFDVYHIKISK
jgi:ubiquinone/menaquinone biosynthesis C-methylase UbiE